MKTFMNITNYRSKLSNPNGQPVLSSSFTGSAAQNGGPVYPPSLMNQSTTAVNSTQAPNIQQQRMSAGTSSKFLFNPLICI